LGWPLPVLINIALILVAVLIEVMALIGCVYLYREYRKPQMEMLYDEALPIQAQPPSEHDVKQRQIYQLKTLILSGQFGVTPAIGKIRDFIRQDERFNAMEYHELTTLRDQLAHEGKVLLDANNRMRLAPR
jgi:hypothetical protein